MQRGNMPKVSKTFVSVFLIRKRQGDFAKREGAFPHEEGVTPKERIKKYEVKAKCGVWFLNER